MNNSNYNRLETAFNKFNEAIIELYSDLFDIFPHKQSLLSDFTLTIQSSTDFFHSLAKQLIL